jgi:hypothetical protein
MEVSSLAGMRLFQTDAVLEAARLALAQGRVPEARVEIDRAKNLIQTTGYHRRQSAITALEGAIERQS